MQLQMCHPNTQRPSVVPATASAPPEATPITRPNPNDSENSASELHPACSRNSRDVKASTPPSAPALELKSISPTSPVPSSPSLFSSPKLPSSPSSPTHTLPAAMSPTFAHVTPLPSGSASSVFRATHRASGAEVVVKTYLKRDLARSGKAKRVAVEREALVRVAQPPLLAATHDEWTVALVTRALPGITVSAADLVSAALSTSPDGLDTTQAALHFRDMQTMTALAGGARGIVRGIIQAMRRIHTSGVVHLDVALENVLVSVADRAESTQPETQHYGTAPTPCPSRNPTDAKGQDMTLAELRDTTSVSIQVVDFSAAALEDSPETDRDYASTTRLDVLPPELIDGSKPPTRAADVWALGVCALRLLYADPDRDAVASIGHVAETSPQYTSPQAGVNTTPNVAAVGGPFRRRGDYATLAAIADRSYGDKLPIPGFRKQKNRTQDDAEDFIQRCLHPDPEKRLGVKPTGNCRTSASTRETALIIDYDAMLAHPFLSSNAEELEETQTTAH